MDGFVVPNTIFARTSEIVMILDAGSAFAHPRCTNVRSLRARCAKPPFCDADGDEADSYDDEGDARKTVLDPTFASIRAPVAKKSLFAFSAPGT